MTDATMAYADGDPHHLRSAVAHVGPASKRIVTGYGFWIFILSDMVMFSAFFATYAVLLGQWLFARHFEGELQAAQRFATRFVQFLSVANQIDIRRLPKLAGVRVLGFHRVAARWKTR